MSKTDDDNRLNSLSRVAVSRRSFLKFMGLGALYLTLPAPKIALSKEENERFSFGKVSPIDRTIGAIAPKSFSGDEPDRTHRIFWDKAEFIASGGGIPEPEEHVPLVIIGGGVSGLTSAYLLRHHRPIILERASRFGGNARGESWNGMDYSIGAAYLIEPEEDSDLDKFFKELNIRELVRVKETHDPIVWNQKIYHHFWEGETSPQRREQFVRLFSYFEDVLKNRNGRFFPDIPIIDAGRRGLIADLDRKTFKEHLEEVVGGEVDPHIQTALEHFSWSSFGASSTEISAAAGLNFYCGELGNVMVAPGGISTIAERILKKLTDTLPHNHFRAESIVFDIRVVSDGVVIAYADSSEKIRSIHAKAVILACPKFVVPTMIDNIEPDRLNAIQRLRYHSYLVANVLLNKPLKDDFYDLFLIGDGSVDLSDPAGSSERQKVTDVVLGSFAKMDPDRSILTLYRGMPYLGARTEIYEDGAYERYRTDFEKQIFDSILPLMNASPENVMDLRLSRWGHPLPVAEAGLIANGTIDVIRKPFKRRVFFVEQDNWMLPAFETAAGEAMIWAPVVDQFLKRGGQ